MSMKIHVDSHEPTYFVENIKGSESTPLSVGDFELVSSEGRKVIIERKTWDDAYGSWISKRLEDQVSRMVMEYDEYILMIEGNKASSRLFRTKKFNQIESLQSFLNRMSAEVIPVIYTSSKKKSAQYIQNLMKRIETGDYQTLVRKTTVVKSSRNKYHNILRLIPNITIDRSKSLYAHFDSLSDFINNVHRAREVDLGSKRWINSVSKIQDFVHAKWDEGGEREILKSVSSSSSSKEKEKEKEIQP